MNNKEYISLDDLRGKNKLTQAERLARVKVLLIDIDDTLRAGDGSINPKNLEMIKKAQAAGIECVMTTGRPRVYPERWYSELGTSRYIISTGGSEIFDCKTNQILQDFPLDNLLMKNAYKVAEKYNSLTPDERTKISPLFFQDGKNDQALRVRFVGGGRNVATVIKTADEEEVFGREGDEVGYYVKETILDENGNPVLGKNGKPQKTTVLKKATIIDGAAKIGEHLVNAVDPEEFFKTARITQVMIGSDNRFTWTHMLNNFTERGLSLPHYSKPLVDEAASRADMTADVQVAGTSKGTATHFLFKHLGLKPGQIAIMGNAMNDVIGMEAVQKLEGFAVAVGNADKEATDAADYKVGPTDQQGAVGYFLEEMLKAKDIVQNTNPEQSM